jgi:sugar lactone lactonase YvrE
MDRRALRGTAVISAQLYNEPATSWPVEGVAADAAGNLYFTDTLSRRVRKVTPTGVISTFAGGGLYSVLGDGGPASKSGITLPTSVAVDAAGDVYIVDGLRVRKVNTAGIISTVAGNRNPSYSGDGGLATNAAMEPETVAVDGAGNLYISDFVTGAFAKSTRRESSPRSPE